MRTKYVARRTSIVDSFHEPALRTQVLVDAVQRSLFFTFPVTFGLNSLTQRPHLDVPFIACPLRFRPPVTFRFPRPSEGHDSPARAFTTEKRRLSFLKINGRRKRRPVYSHCRGWSFCRGWVLLFHFRQNKTLLLKRIGTVRIKEDGHTHAFFSDCVLNSCERDFQTPWIRRERQEQPELLRGWLHGNRQHANDGDRQRGRVLPKIELQEFQKEFAISRRHREPNRPDVKDSFLRA